MRHGRYLYASRCENRTKWSSIRRTVAPSWNLNVVCWFSESEIDMLVAESVINISNLSPTHLVSNIRHQQSTKIIFRHLRRHTWQLESDVINIYMAKKVPIRVNVHDVTSSSKDFQGQGSTSTKVLVRHRQKFIERWKISKKYGLNNIIWLFQPCCRFDQTHGFKK